MVKKPFEAYGYAVVKALRDTTRNATFIVEKDGQKYFAKQCLNKEPIKMENDVWWMLTIKRLAGKDGPIIAPELYEHGSGWFVSEYIDRPLLAEPGWGHGEAELLPLANRLADILSWLDKALTPQSVAADYDLTNSAPYNNLMKKVNGWLEQPIAKGRVAKNDFEAAKRLIDENQSGLVPSFQHGDFVPWHFFDLGDQLCLFDGEHSGLNKPKYYDLAYIYTRLYTRSAAPRAARAILKRFIDNSSADPATFMGYLLPVMTLRALGMQADADNDFEQYDYTLAAQDILQRCLTRDLKALTKG